MVRKIFCVALLLLLALVEPLSAQEKRAITLKDGTKIIGEIISFENGVYTLETSFGQVAVPDTNIVSIASASASAPSLPPIGAPSLIPSGIPMDGQIESIQGQLMQDPNFIAKAQDLSKNPEVMQILSQPDVAQAIMNRDITALQNNPKIRELLNNPQVLDLIQVTGQKLQSGQ